MAASNSTRQAVPGSITRLSWLAFATMVAVFMLWLLGHVVLLAFAAILLAIAFRSGVDGLVRLTRWPRLLCVALLLVAVIGSLAGVLVFGGTRLAEQGSQLWQQIVSAAASFRDWLVGFEWGRALVESTSVEDVAGQSGQILVGFGNTLLSLVGVSTGLVIAVVVAIYFAVAPKVYVEGFLRLLPLDKRDRWREILSTTGDKLRSWMLAQGVAMVLVAVGAFIGLTLIGVPMAMLLALIAGITNFVPFIGPVVGFAPALLVAFSESPEMALWVGVLFVVIQFIEGNVIEPLLQRRISRLPPVMTILSQTVMGTVFGVLGVIMAMPMLVVTLNVVRKAYVEDVLGDRRDDDDGDDGDDDG